MRRATIGLTAIAIALAISGCAAPGSPTPQPSASSPAEAQPSIEGDSSTGCPPNVVERWTTNGLTPIAETAPITDAQLTEVISAVELDCLFGVTDGVSDVPILHIGFVIDPSTARLEEIAGALAALGFVSDEKGGWSNPQSEFGLALITREMFGDEQPLTYDIDDLGYDYAALVTVPN